MGPLNDADEGYGRSRQRAADASVPRERHSRFTVRGQAIQLGVDLRTERHPATNRYDYSCTSDAESQSPACHHQSAWMLILRCPRCEYEHEDGFDVLDTDALGSMKCGACRSTFWFAVMECHRCAHEEAFEWPGTLSESELRLLVCRACCRTFRYHEDSPDQEIETWT